MENIKFIDNVDTIVYKGNIDSIVSPYIPNSDYKFYVQNMAFMYSDKGPDFVTKTIGRPLTISEIACFDLKRSENINRKKGN